MLAYQVLTIASVLALTSAQASLPPCVLSCYSSAITAAPSCTSTDFTCLCKSTAFQTAVGQCLSTTCTSQAEIQAGEQFGVTTCQSVGITVAAPSLSLNNPSATGAGTGTGASSSSSSSGGAATTTSSGSSSSGTSTAATTSSTVVVSGTSSTTSKTTVSSASSSTSSGAHASTSSQASSGTKTQISGVLAVVMGFLVVV